MDFAGLPDERGVRSVAAHASSGAHDLRIRRPRRRIVRSEPVYGSRGNPTPSLTINPPAGDVDPAAVAPETADHRQAEYFLRLLTQSRRLSDHRIDQCHQAIATSEANGDVEGAASFRRIVRIEEQDREAIDSLIENLRRRFPLGAPSEVSPIPRRARIVAR
jgi:hypothetical protein